MCSFVTESCPKTQSYIYDLKTVNRQNEMNTDKAQNYISLLLKGTFWWCIFEKMSHYPAASYLVMVVDIFNAYIYNEKLKFVSAMPSLYKNINIYDLFYQFNSLADSNTEY